ncbi:MAG: hypothetical protein OEV44_14870, partial [Spirochaetota bacterium]|nr:hypothetical protein [Spirochaetota bacterium]
DFKSQKSLNMHYRAKHPEKLDTKPTEKQSPIQINTSKSNAKQHVNPIGTILYALVTILFLVMWIINSLDKEIIYYPKFIQPIKATFTQNSPAISIWGPLKLSKKNDNIFIKIVPIGLSHSRSIPYSYESWVSGELSLVDAKKLENNPNQLKLTDELKKILKVDQPKNVSLDQGNKEIKIIEDYSFPFNFWYASGYDEGYYWTESEIEETKYIRVSDPKDYYLLMEYSSNKPNFKNNNFIITVVEGRRFIYLYVAGFFVSLFIFIFSFISYRMKRKLMKAKT